MDNQEITIHQTPSFFMNKEVFEHGQRVAVMLSKSDLIPKTFQNNIGNCVIALNMANRMGADPLMVMQNLYVVHGKPAWSSKFLIATLNASGKYSSIKYEDSENNGGSTRAFATDKSTNEICYGAWVSMDMAKAEGWVEKNGSKWKTMPEVMRRYRAASFFVNQFAPEISMGIQTEYEVQDVPYEDITTKKESTSLHPTEEDQAASADKITQLKEQQKKVKINDLRRKIEEATGDQKLALEAELEELEGVA